MNIWWWGKRTKVEREKKSHFIPNRWCKRTLPKLIWFLRTHASPWMLVKLWARIYPSNIFQALPLIHIIVLPVACMRCIINVLVICSHEQDWIDEMIWHTLKIKAQEYISTHCLILKQTCFFLFLLFCVSWYFILITIMYHDTHKCDALARILFFTRCRLISR